MGAYENPGQFQIYDPTGDVMLAQAFSQVGTNIMKALQERKKKAKETLFRSFELNEKEREAQAKQDAVIANAAIDANFDVAKMRDFIDGLKDEQFKLSQKRNSYIAKGEVPPQELTDQYDQISNTIRIGVPTLLNTYKQFNEAGNQVTQGALGDQGGTSALVNSTAMDLLQKFSSSTEGKYEMGWITDSNGKRELGFIAEDGTQASFTGLSEAASYYGRKVPNADKNFEDSEVIKQQKQELKSLFTKDAINAAFINNSEEAERTYEKFGKIITTRVGNTVTKQFVLDPKKVEDATKTALENRAAEVVANSTPEQLEDIYNSVLMTVKKDKDGNNVFVNATNPLNDDGKPNEGQPMLFDGNTTPEEIKAFKEAYINHYKGGMSRELAKVIKLEEYTVSSKEAKQTQIDTTGVMVAENLLELPIAKQFQALGGAGVMAEDQEEEMLDNFIKTANSAGKGPQYISKAELNKHILDQNVDGAGNITTSTDAKKARNIVDFYVKEKGAENRLEAEKMILNDYANKLGGGDDVIYKLDKNTPRQLSPAEKKRLKTYKGRYELISEYTNIDDKTDKLLKDAFMALDKNYSDDVNEVLQQVITQISNDQLTVEQVNNAGGINAMVKRLINQEKNK